MGFALADLAYEFPKIVALDADLRSSTGLHIFEHFHPGKLVKSGIAEQNLVAMAAGLSQEGYVPFPCTFDAFSRRMLDQLYVTVAYSNLNVKFIGAYVGLFTGKAGATHQSDKELGTLLRVPRLTVVEPSCNEEMRQVMRAAVETPGPWYIRIVRCEVANDLIGSDYRFEVGKGVTVVDEGTDVGLVTTGFMLQTAELAAEKLKKLGIGVRIDHYPTLKPFDRELLYDMAGKVGTMITLENHCVSGGLHSLVAEALVARGIGKRVGAIGTDPNDFIHTGHVNDLLWRYRMSSDDVVAMAAAQLGSAAA
jgi:transketolase